MSAKTWQRALQGSDFAKVNLELAAQRPEVAERYALDPLAHLEDGHVLILGLAADDDDDIVTYADDDGQEVRLKRMVFKPYVHEIELMHAWPDMDHLTRTGQLRWNNVHEEKSRQMGITWTAAWLLLWALMYHDETAGLAVHLKLSKVDDGGSNNTPESIFGRIRFMAESRQVDGGTTWPLHMRPADYLDFRGGSDPNVTNRYNGARLVGTGATEDPGRGGTYTHALIDEAARISWASAVQASLRSACPRGRFYNSTPHGKDNAYYQLRDPRRRGFTYLRHHWSIHPVYGQGAHIAGEHPDECRLCAGTVTGLDWNPNDPQAHRYPGKLTSPWYENTVIELTDEQVAQEYDISYEQSLEARVYPEFSAEVHVLPYIAFAPDVSIETSWDFGADTTAVGIWQEYADYIVKIGELEAHDATPEGVAKALRNVMADLGVPIAQTGPSFTRQMLHVGDPAGNQTQQATARTLLDDYRAQGFSIVTQRTQLVRTINAMKRLLMGRPKPVRYSAATCPKTIRHLEQNRWPVDRHGNRKIGATEPHNDEHNHMMRADAYYVTWKFPPPNADESLPSGSQYLVDDEPLYKRVDSAADVPLGHDDAYRNFM